MRFLNLTSNPLSHPEDSKQLYEVQIILESGIAALAATNHDADDMQAFEKSLKDMTRKSIDIEEYVAADMAFPRSVVGASKMPFWWCLFPW